MGKTCGEVVGLPAVRCGILPYISCKGVCGAKVCWVFKPFFFLKLVIDFVIFHGQKLDISFREESVRMCCVAYKIVTFLPP